MILMACPIVVQGKAVSGTSQKFLVDILSASVWLGWDLIKKAGFMFLPFGYWFTRTGSR